MAIFNYSLATDTQKKELVAFSEKLNTFDQKGDNVQFGETITEIANYQLKTENSNIWVSTLHPCCEGRGGAFHLELKKEVSKFAEIQKKGKAQLSENNKKAE